MSAPCSILSRRKVKDLLALPSLYMVDTLFPKSSIATPRGIPESVVVRFLNEHGVGMPRVDYIPGLVDEKTVADGVTMDGEPVTVKDIRRWCSRHGYPLPHYRLSRNYRRFTPGVVEWWKSYINSGVYIDFRKYTIGAEPYLRKDA